MSRAYGGRTKVESKFYLITKITYDPSKGRGHYSLAQCKNIVGRIFTAYRHYRDLADKKSSPGYWVTHKGFPNLELMIAWIQTKDGVEAGRQMRDEFKDRLLDSNTGIRDIVGPMHDPESLDEPFAVSWTDTGLLPISHNYGKANLSLNKVAASKLQSMYNNPPSLKVAMTPNPRYCLSLKQEGDVLNSEWIVTDPVTGEEERYSPSIHSLILTDDQKDMIDDQILDSFHVNLKSPSFEEERDLYVRAYLVYRIVVGAVREIIIDNDLVHINEHEPIKLEYEGAEYLELMYAESIRQTISNHLPIKSIIREIPLDD